MFDADVASNSWSEWINDPWYSQEVFVVNHFTPWYKKGTGAVIGASEAFDSTTFDYPGPWKNQRFKFYIISLSQGLGCINRVNMMYAMTNVINEETIYPRAFMKLIVNQNHKDEITLYI